MSTIGDFSQGLATDTDLRDNMSAVQSFLDHEPLVRALSVADLHQVVPDITSLHQVSLYLGLLGQGQFVKSVNILISESLFCALDTCTNTKCHNYSSYYQKFTNISQNKTQQLHILMSKKYCRNSSLLE